MVEPLLNKAISTNIKKLLLWIVCYEQQLNSKILIKSSLVKIIYVSIPWKRRVTPAIQVDWPASQSSFHNYRSMKTVVPG